MRSDGAVGRWASALASAFCTRIGLALPARTSAAKLARAWFAPRLPRSDDRPVDLTARGRVVVLGGSNDEPTLRRANHCRGDGERVRLS